MHKKNALDVFKMEANAILQVADKLDEVFNSVIDEILLTKGRVIICGMGKSGHIAKKIVATLISTGTPSFFLHPAEAFHGDLGMVLPEDVFIAISNSGETEELIRLVPFIQDNKNLLISLTGNTNSTLAISSDYHLDIGVNKEACSLNLAPTSSTTATLAMGDAIAISLMKARNFKPENFAKFHPGGALGKKLIHKVKDYVQPALFIKASDTFTDVVAHLVSSSTGVVIVGSENNVNGIITDGDLKRSLNSTNRNHIFELKAKDIMSENPKVIASDMRCSDADEKMHLLGVNTLLVIRDQVVLGIYQNLNKSKK